MRVIFLIFITFITADALIALVEESSVMPATQTATSTAPASGAIIGTLTYYPNNVGTQIPYLVYKTPSGATATKILLFDSSSSCATTRGTYPCPLIAGALSAYYDGSFIEARGTIENESLHVCALAPG